MGKGGRKKRNGKINIAGLFTRMSQNDIFVEEVLPMVPHLRENLKLLITIWLGGPITFQELAADFGPSADRRVFEERILLLEKEELIRQSLGCTFSLSQKGRRYLAGQLRSLVDSAT